MEIMELIESRHSVRQYIDKPIELEKRTLIDRYVKEINKESGLNIQVVYDEPTCFNSLLAHYGHFKNVSNYLCLIGKKGDSLEEDLGYFGEKLVLSLQEIGLNSCWVKLTHGKPKCAVNKEEKLECIIAFGYGSTQGVPHKSKSIADCSNYTPDSPEWFTQGMKAVMLAPTAVNQQKFYFEYNNDLVTVTTKNGPCAKMDVGIVKLHFELVTGRKCE